MIFFSLFYHSNSKTLQNEKKLQFYKEFTLHVNQKGKKSLSTLIKAPSQNKTHVTNLPSTHSCTRDPTLRTRPHIFINYLESVSFFIVVQLRFINHSVSLLFFLLTFFKSDTYCIIYLILNNKINVSTYKENMKYES